MAIYGRRKADALRKPRQFVSAGAATQTNPHTTPSANIAAGARRDRGLADGSEVCRRQS
jgi:hypothetical protein